MWELSREREEVVPGQIKGLGAHQLRHVHGAGTQGVRAEGTGGCEVSLDR